MVYKYLSPLVACGLWLAMAIAAPASPVARPSHQGAPAGALAVAFATAARNYGVPASLLLAVSYVETRWNVLIWNRDAPDGPEGVYGPMGLYGAAGGPGTLHQAARLLGVSPTLLKTDPSANIRGAAAVLATDQRALFPHLPVSAPVSDWYEAVAQFAGLRYRQPAQQFADTVFRVLATGVQGTASDGEVLRVPAQQVTTPPASQAALLSLPALPVSRADVPWIHAVIPVGDTGFTGADRPRDGLAIQYIIIHSTEGDYAGTVRAFTDLDHCCSAHYVVDGENAVAYPTVTQFVPARDIAYHAGNYWYNQHALGLEHVGFSDSPNSYYTQSLYDTSAELAGYLAATYGIPLDRAHLVGHGNVPAPSAGDVHPMHWDPGPYWDWPYYLARVRLAYEQWTHNAPLPAPAVPPADRAPRAAIRVVAVDAARDSAADVPAWSSGRYTNAIPVYADDRGRPSSQLVLGASDSATWQSPTRYDRRDFSCDNLPLYTRGGGGKWLEDTNSDLRARAEYGEAYVRLRSATFGGSTWDEIDFNGVTGWIKDSETTPGWGVVVTFAGGTVPTTIYGAPLLDHAHVICPDISNGFSRAGQSYAAQAADTTSPGGPWYQIYYSHRLVWVPAREVIAR